MPIENKVLGEEIMRLWADTYLFQKMDSLQKRLFDWWTGEGFFYASNFKDVPDGMSAELMLLMGGNAYGIVRNGNEGNRAADLTNAKKNEGWDMLRFGNDGYYLLRDTKDNRVRVKALLEENIRNYELVEFTSKEINGEQTLKSVIIVVHRKKVKV